MRTLSFARGILFTLIMGAMARPPIAEADFAQPGPVPLERLIKNAETYLSSHPKEADAHYTLARIHYLAFHLRRDQLPAFPDPSSTDGKPLVIPRLKPTWSTGDTVPNTAPLSDDRVIEHAEKAMESFGRALRLNPKEALYHLGIASLMEEIVVRKAASPPDSWPKSLRKINIEQCREAYTKAFKLAMVKDAELQSMPIGGITSITGWEAGQDLLRLAKDHPDKLSQADLKVVEEAKTAMKSFGHLQVQVRMITPIVLSLRPGKHLAELLNPSHIVDFDLRGHGLADRWPWVKPELGFLVWDPEHTGRIASARQLFGGYTFQIFRRNGYEALAALDDNGDGSLTGEELEGIAVWFDRNGDGVSSPEEVVSLSELGIVAISTQPEGRDGIHPTTAKGITLRDGRVLRTWDWMVAPARAPLAGVSGN